MFDLAPEPEPTPLEWYEDQAIARRSELVHQLADVTGEAWTLDEEGRIRPDPEDAEAAGEPWLSMKEGAAYVKRARPNGAPRDSFYVTMRDTFGARRKLVRRSELDALVESGAL